MALQASSEETSVDPQRPLPAPFLTKTYQLVDDPSTDPIISWNHDGSTFVVWRTPEFARDLLPFFFKHNNFSSFVRQLNTYIERFLNPGASIHCGAYGFRKIVPDRWEFANEFFRKGERHLLYDIHRRKSLQLISGAALPSKRSLSPTDSAEEQDLSSNSSPLSIPRDANDGALSRSDESERLKKENLLLLSELSCLRRLCSDLLLYIQKHVKGSPQDINKFLQSNCSAWEKVSFAQSARSSAEGDNAPQLPHQEVSRGTTSPVEENLMTNLCSRTPSIARLPLSSDTSLEEPGCHMTDCISEAFQGDSPSPPRLFGVPLQGRKKMNLGSSCEELQKKGLKLL